MLLSKDEVAEAGHLRSILKSTESAHVIEVSLLKSKFQSLKRSSVPPWVGSPPFLKRSVPLRAQS